MTSSKDQKTQDVCSNANGDTEWKENVAEEQKREKNNDGSNPGKIFIGGLSRSTTSSAFTKHFNKYGKLSDSVIMKDRLTGQPRGFGFVTYDDPSVIDKVIQDKHVFDGKTVEIKRTIPRGNSSKGPKTKKVFVGGIPTSITEDEFKGYFSKFGKVVEHQIMQDRSTGRSRGFGFITFDSEQAAEELISQGRMLELGGKQVEIKKAEPKKPFADAGPVMGSIAGYVSNPYRLAGGYGDRPGGYAWYGGPDYGRGYGGYGGGSLGRYTEDASRGQGGPTGSYREGFGGYDGGITSGYGVGDGYGTYGDSGFGGSFESRGRGPYGSGGSYGIGRGSAYGGSSNGRYHPYAR